MHCDSGGISLLNYVGRNNKSKLSRHFIVTNDVYRIIIIKALGPWFTKANIALNSIRKSETSGHDKEHKQLNM